ncbi:MAG TPA: glycosyltransferase family 2 protein [Gemmatimonadaceae bacterium]|nr:glycosyltransferase family 2 protein [Gemmatimonadaceae bacterium]
MTATAEHLPATAVSGRSGRVLLSVVVPVYNESAVLGMFYDRTVQSLEALPDLDFELIFVDDGSVDDSFSQLSLLAAHDRRVRIVRFSRNFGHQIAITAGLDHAGGDCIVFIDADLQDPPEVIAGMLAKWREGYEVIYGVRAERRGEGRLKLLTAKIFYRLLKRITGVEIPVDVGDFRLIGRRAANELRALREKDRFVRGLVSWIGFRQTGVTYTRDKRYAGETKYPYRKMIKFALDGITAFSTLPLKLATWLGYASSALAFLYLVSVFVQKMLGNTVQGWATIMVALLFLGGVQLIALGIIGEYLGRLFNESKPRPMYIVAERIGLESPVDPGNVVTRRAAP